MKNKLIVANWKMYTDLAEATILVTTVGNNLRERRNIEIVLCPPSVWLVPIAELIKKNHYGLRLGAQNVFYKNEGAYTGEISPLMIEKICDYVIIGHSERRIYFKEDEGVVNLKIQAVLKNGLRPILCVGEFKKKEDKSYNEEGDHAKVDETIFRELSLGLEGVSSKQVKNIIIAYEPIWAIGTGKPARGHYVVQVIRGIRDRLALIYDRETADRIKILYGGSISVSTAEDYLKRPEIDGLLIGGTSLKAKEFIEICQQATL